MEVLTYSQTYLDVRNELYEPPCPLSLCCDQSQLEECLKKQAEIQRALDLTKMETQSEKESRDTARMEWEREREAMKEEISELRHNMRQTYETIKKMEGKHKVRTGHATNQFLLTSKMF